MSNKRWTTSITTKNTIIYIQHLLYEDFEFYNITWYFKKIITILLFRLHSLAMVDHPCSQTQTIKEIQKDVQSSRERDILQSEQILNMQKDIGEVKTDIKTILTKIELLEWKFASKWVEWVIKGMIWLILLTVLWAMLAKVIIK